MEYLAPFLEVIRSHETSGPITGVALTSVRRMLDQNILGTHPPHPQLERAHCSTVIALPKTIAEQAALQITVSLSSPVWWAADAEAGQAEAMAEIAEAVTQCKFEATDRESDEVVLYKILQVSDWPEPSYPACNPFRLWCMPLVSTVLRL